MSIKQNLKKRKLFGDMDWGFSLPALVLVILITIPAIIWEEDINEILNNFFTSFVNRTDWLFVLLPALLIVACLWMAFSKYGKIVIGDPNEKSYMSTFTYLATLMAMLYGSTIMRTSTVQWAIVAADPPFGIVPYSNEAILTGQAYSMFLWSLPMAAIYAATAPCVAYFLHNRKQPVLHCSKMCRSLFGDKFADGILGKIFDIIFILALVLGAATFIGLAAPMLSAVVAKLIGIETSFMLDVIITIAMIILFTCSAWLGMEKGIERLSRLNVWLAVALLVIIMIAGPGMFIVSLGVDAVGVLLDSYMRFALSTDALNTGATNGTVSYTVFWWAYCFSWGIIYGIFGGMISKGRTIREMILAYFVTVFGFAIPISSLLGGMSINAHMKGLVDVFDGMQVSAGYAIAEILSVQNLAPLVMIVFAGLTFTFLGTTMDSTTYTMASYASKNDMTKEAPSKGSRLIWALLMSGGALAMMKVGGLKPLEVVAAIAGVPVIFITIILIFAGKKMMDEDKAWITNVRPIDWDPATAPVAERAEDRFD